MSEPLQGASERIHELGPRPPGPIRHVLVCLDGSTAGETCLAHALAVAETFGARMTLLRVLEDEKGIASHEPVDAIDWEMRRSEANLYLERTRKLVAKREVPVETRLAQGHAAEQILRLVAEGEVDLVALSTHGEKGRTDWTLSGTSEKVVARAGVSILLVPSFGRMGGDAQYRKVLVPLDGSLRAESVLGSLGILARKQQSELILTHAVPPMQLTYCATPTHRDLELLRTLAARNERVATEYLERTSLRLVREGLDVRTVLGANEDVREFLGCVAEKEGVDLIAISAHGSTGSRSRRYGAVARDLISEVMVPLLIFQDLPCRPTHRENAAPARVWLRKPRASLAPDSAGNRARS